MAGGTVKTRRNRLIKSGELPGRSKRPHKWKASELVEAALRAEPNRQNKSLIAEFGVGHSTITRVRKRLRVASGNASPI